MFTCKVLLQSEYSLYTIIELRNRFHLREPMLEIATVLDPTHFVVTPSESIILLFYPLSRNHDVIVIIARPLL